MRTAADLAAVLRELRRRHARQSGRAELSYRELAQAAGWSHGIIGEYLAGRVLPPTDRFDVLVRLLGATAAEQGALATARDRVAEARRLTRLDGDGPGVVAVGEAAEAGNAARAGQWHADGAPVPRQLPMDVYGFTGRARELAALDVLAFASAEKRAGAVVVSALSGTAGVGKTALAVHWAHRAADRFPDGQLYLDLRGYGPEPPVEPADALARLLRGLGVVGPRLPAETADRATLYRSLLAERRMLVLLDNAATAEQARPLLPGAPSCFVVVTSRDNLAGLVAREGARRIGLAALSAEEAVTLLRTLMSPQPDGDGVTTAELAELAERCSRLPLALRIAAELASGNPGRSPAEVVAGLRDEQRRLDLLDAAGDPRTAVRSVLSWSYQCLSGAGARAFRLLGLHPSREFDVHALAALADLDLDRASALISELARAHLVEPAGGDGFAMHDLLRAYAAERAEESCGSAERYAALSRLFDHYLSAAAAAMDTLFPHERRSRPAPGPPRTALPELGEAASALRWLEQWRGALVAAGVYAGRHGWPQHCVDLSRVLWRAFEVGGHYQEALTLHEHAARDSPGRAAALANLGSIRWWLGDHRAARECFEQALEGHRRVGDRDGEARALARLGLVHERLGDYRAAAEHLSLALASFRAAGDRHGEGAQLINLGALRRRLGDREQAIRELRQAAEIFVALGDPRLEGYALGNLAATQSEAGQHAEALEHLERSLELCRRTGDRGGEGSALSTIGAVHGRAGRYVSALEYLRRGLAVSRETGDRSLETETLNSLGETLLAMGRPGAAPARHRAALDLAERNGDRFEQARALRGLAAALDGSGSGRVAEAHECRIRARDIRRALGIEED